MLLRGQRNFNNIVWVHVRQRSYLSHPIKIVDTSETEQQLCAMLYSHFGSSSSPSSCEVELGNYLFSLHKAAEELSIMDFHGNLQTGLQT